MKKVFALFLSVFLLFMTIPISAVAADESQNINKYNVVFVIDASTSMKYSDEKNNRFEATDLFLGMLANEGNYVGTVTFNGNISSTDISQVSGNESKKAISKAIRGTSLDADTNIGEALLKATSLIQENGNKNLRSIIILLSDGNTDFDDPKQVQESKKQKETALETARDNGYSVYAVSLNNDGKADAKELKSIANATENGMFEEVNNSADLKDVFDKFYTEIYGTQSTKLVDDTIGKNGTTSKSFQISDVGVEEVNVAIFGDISECYLKRPDGSQVSNSDMKEITFSANTFRILKLVNPQAGKWELTVTGKPGANITVVKTYNVNLSVKTTIENEDDSYKINNPINIAAKIYEDDQEVTDLSKYSGFKGVIKVTDYDGNVVYETEVTQPTEKGFEFSFTPTELNTYYANISVEGSEVYANAEELTFNIGNTAPQALQETIKKHINIFPFLIKTNSTIDLSSAAKDNEDENLQYKIVSSTWNEEDYTVDGSNLTIDSFKNVSKGSFEVQAFDTQGAYCTFIVKVTSTNIGVLAMILMLVGIIIAIVIIVILGWIFSNKAFMGEVTATNLHTYQSNKPMQSRGKIKLSAFQIGDTGFDKNAYFQATGKDYVYFISKKPVSTDSMLNKSKKVKIENNLSTRIYSDDDHTKGIEVKFISYKNNPMF